MRNLLPLAPLFVLLAACAMETTGDDGDDEDTGSTTSMVRSSCKATRAQILASVSGARRTVLTRGFTWLDEEVPYSQSKQHKGYRTDCSGFVSMAWQTGTSFTTADFASGGGKSSKLPSYDALVPGDALVRRAGGSGHVVLFLGWNDAKRTGACVIEQASTALDMEFGVRTTASLKSGGYKAIRSDALDGSGAEGNADEGAGAEDDASEDDATTDGATKDTASDKGGAACASDGACNPGNDGSGKICVGGRCVAGCRKDAHCPGITTCRAGVCR